MLRQKERGIDNRAEGGEEEEEEELTLTVSVMHVFVGGEWGGNEGGRMSAHGSVLQVTEESCNVFAKQGHRATPPQGHPHNNALLPACLPVVMAMLRAQLAANWLRAHPSAYTTTTTNNNNNNNVQLLRCALTDACCRCCRCMVERTQLNHRQLEHALPDSLSVKKTTTCELTVNKT
ncbi:hypothetical protein EYF80_049494 [Liparis tanakae]|uniref:Uncharacterized protein n=1 Tax=Liparis tanakae TaxID=230148 RepID=A0A4Z2FJ75_9TELE|nr:hypothetical protein EYF80_049494 [Liparis tanakae]